MSFIFARSKQVFAVSMLLMVPSSLVHQSPFLQQLTIPLQIVRNALSCGSRIISDQLNILLLVLPDHFYCSSCLWGYRSGTEERSFLTPKIATLQQSLSVLINPHQLLSQAAISPYLAALYPAQHHLT